MHNSAPHPVLATPLPLPLLAQWTLTILIIVVVTIITLLLLALTLALAQLHKSAMQCLPSSSPSPPLLPLLPPLLCLPLLRPRCQHHLQLCFLLPSHLL